MNKKLIFAGFTVVILVVAVSAISRARADNDNENDNNQNNGLRVGQMMNPLKPGLGLGREMEDVMKRMNRGFESELESREQESVIIKASGDFRVAGAVVNSVNAAANTINVSLYGFSRDINLGGAKIYGGGQTIAVSDITPGDKLIGRGNFNEATRAITVSEINDISRNAKNVSEIQNQIQNLMNQVRQLQEQLKSMLRF